MKSRDIGHQKSGVNLAQRSVCIIVTAGETEAFMHVQQRQRPHKAESPSHSPEEVCSFSQAAEHLSRDMTLAADKASNLCISCLFSHITPPTVHLKIKLKEKQMERRRFYKIIVIRSKCGLILQPTVQLNLIKTSIVVFFTI